MYSMISQINEEFRNAAKAAGSNVRSAHFPMGKEATGSKSTI
jgi:hypothetical protein